MPKKNFTYGEKFITHIKKAVEMFRIYWAKFTHFSDANRYGIPHRLASFYWFKIYLIFQVYN